MRPDVVDIIVNKRRVPGESVKQGKILSGLAKKQFRKCAQKARHPKGYYG